MPKYMTMSLQRASATSLPVGALENIEQIINITNSAHGQKNVALRMKIDFVVGETLHQSTASVSGFPHLY